mmetsp:Transcript_125946/g.352657  ORF Transcript_125946/g.352657 Transcript_125946/m.352657 type:complete len:278 (-) Transcript_125946:42-875(-)
MTVTFKKVGEAVASRVVQSSKTAVKAAGSITPTREVKPPRAISKEEAPHMIPARESTKTTMMPWRGWVDRFLKDKMTPEQYSTMRNTFYFWPEDPYNLWQMPPGTSKIPVAADGQEAGFREVSPGSQPAVDIPLHALDDDPYDSGYFKKDTRRRYVDPEFPHPEIEQLKLDMQDPNDPEVQAAKEKLAAGPKSSPGNGLRFATGPSNFDPTGLRAVMAVTNAEIEKEMDKHMPDHLPEPIWKEKEDALFNWYKERDLPVPMGGNWNFVKKEKRVARW